MEDVNESLAESDCQTETAKSGNRVRDGELLMGQRTAFDCLEKHYGISD
jgi:hypothetical protein